MSRRLERTVVTALSGRALRVAGALGAVLVAADLVRSWSALLPLRRGTTLALTVCAVLLAVSGQRWCESFERWAREPRSPLVVLAGWVLVAPLAVAPVPGAAVLLVAGPLTAAWCLARGWGVPEVLGLAFSCAMLALGRTTLAALPLVALSLRARPGLAFGSVLLLGAVLRASLTVSVPRPLWTPDSYGYVALAYQLLGSGDLATEIGRPPLVPALVLATLWLGGSHFVFVVVAHVIGLLTAWWAGGHVRRRFGDLAGWQTCAALALAPELVHYEHSLMSEASFVACMTLLTVKLLDLSATAPTPLTALTLGLAAGLVAVARPVALLAPVAVLAAAALARWRPWRLTLVAAGGALPLLLLCSFNLLANGYFGVTSPSFRGLVLFSVFGDRVVLDSPENGQVKDEMRACVLRYRREHGPTEHDGNYLIWAPDGPLGSSPTLGAMSPEERGRVVSELAVEAIRADPHGFVERTTAKVRTYLVGPRTRNDGYAALWDAVVFSDQTRRHLPPGCVSLADTPSLVRPFEGERTFRLVFEPLSLVLTHGVGQTVFGKQAFSHYKDPWAALLLVALIWRLPYLRDWRVPALALVAVWVATMAPTCVFSEPIPRYRLQVYPIGVMLTALALADPRRRALAALQRTS